MKIGDQVIKRSGKPFKSTFKTNTIKDIVINEQDPKKRQAATFIEDDSIVSLDMLKLAIQPQVVLQANKRWVWHGGIDGDVERDY